VRARRREFIAVFEHHLLIETLNDRGMQIREYIFYIVTDKGAKSEFGILYIICMQAIYEFYYVSDMHEYSPFHGSWTLYCIGIRRPRLAGR